MAVGDNNLNINLEVSISGDNTAKERLKSLQSFVEQTERKASLLSRMRVNAVINAVDRASRVIRSVTTAAEKLKPVKTITIEAYDKASGVIRRVVDLATRPLTILGAGAGATAAITYPLKLAGNMEQANVAMTTLLGNQDKAKKFMDQLTDFAVKTPFEMPQLLDGSRRLLAFGFAAESVIPMLTAVGNAASGLGLGVEGMNRIILALGQMRAKGKVQGEEMLQLTEAGINAWDMLAKAMGKTTAQVMKMSSDGLIPAQQAIDILIKGMNEQFKNMMDNQSRTLFGLFSTIKDWANLKFFWAFGEGIRQGILPPLMKFVDLLSNNDAAAKKVQDTLMSLGRTLSNWVVTKIKEAYQWFQKLIGDEQFRKLDLGGKIIYVLDKALDGVNQWMDGPGGKKVGELFQKLGVIAGKAWLHGIMSLLGGAGSNISQGNFAGGLAMLLAANMMGGGLLLQGVGLVLRGAGAAGRGFLNLLRRSGSVSAGQVASVAEETATTTRAIGVGGLLSRAGGALRPLGRALIPLGIGLDLFSIFRSSPEDRAKAIGGTAGRWGGALAGAKLGAAGGAAVGSVIPGVGTAVGAGVGAFLGGVGGYFAGGAIGEKIGASWGKIKSAANDAWGSIKQKASDTLNWISTHLTLESLAKGAGYVYGYLEETIFNGGWWNQKWEAVKTWTNNAWSGMVGVWNSTKTTISETLFSGDWWAAKWEAVKTWTNNAWADSVSIWEGIKTTISNTLFSGKWWAEKWNYVKSFGSDALGFAKNKWDEISSAFNAGREEGRKAAMGTPAPDYNAFRALKGYASGGILTMPHVGMVAEQGPEAIIPLSSRLRSRALDLWRQTGEYLGVKPYADGGFVEAVPAMAGVGDGGGVNITISGLAINLLASEIDEDTLALRVGRVIVGEIKKAFDNRA